MFSSATYVETWHYPQLLLRAVLPCRAAAAQAAVQ